MAEAQQAATFEEFYRACFDRLVGQLALVTGSLPEAEDLVQEQGLGKVARRPFRPISRD
jgi:DNA-directed RNA polymerase specialized sigma24 family protein